MMTDREIDEALDFAGDKVVDVQQELKRRGWDTRDALRLWRSIEDYRVELKEYLQQEAANAGS